MFSSTRLQAFVCLALGIAVSAAPAAAPRANLDARSPDVYDLSGGIVGAILGLEGQGYGGDSDEDVYILKRQQLAGLGVSSTLGSNMGLTHAAALGEGVLAASGNTKRDVYDLDGGLTALLLGLGGERGGSGDEDTYILKRRLADIGLDVGSRLNSNLGLAHAAALGEGALAASGDIKRDTYDLDGGLTALLLGFGGERGGSGDEDTYILKRQLANPNIGTSLSSNVGLSHAKALGEGALAATGDIKRDVYDLGGGLTGLLLGLGGEGFDGAGNEDTYILKRQLERLDIASNMGIAHAVGLGQGALGLSSKFEGGAGAANNVV